MRSIYGRTLAWMVMGMLLFVGAGHAQTAPTQDPTEQKIEAIHAMEAEDFDAIFGMVGQTDGASGEALESKIEESFGANSEGFLNALSRCEEPVRLGVADELAWIALMRCTESYAPAKAYLAELDRLGGLPGADWGLMALLRQELDVQKPFWEENLPEARAFEAW